jgi:hypothetical protein
MSPSLIPWGTLLTEAATLFVFLLALGLGLMGVWTLWSQGR